MISGSQRAFKISIAMATYNGSRFIQTQLESLARQTFLPTELVICDDGSADSTLSIIEDFTYSAPFIVRLFQNETRVGYRGNFMQAAARCSGDLIAFCDQDDIWYEDKLERMVKCFEDDVLLVYHDYDLIDAEGEISSLLTLGGSETFAPLSCPPTWNNPQGFTMLWRRELLAFNDVFEQSCCKAEQGMPAGHDQWISYLASSFGTSVHLREPLAGYRQHGQNVFGHHGRKTDPRQEVRLLHAAVDAFKSCLATAVETPWPVASALTKNAHFAEDLRLRLHALTMPEIKTRLSCYLRLCLTGAYFRADWPLGKRALFQDFPRVLNLR